MVPFVCTGLPILAFHPCNLPYEERRYFIGTLKRCQLPNFTESKIYQKKRGQALGEQDGTCPAVFFSLLTNLLGSTCRSGKSEPNDDLWMRSGSPAEQPSGAWQRQTHPCVCTCLQPGLADLRISNAKGS